MLIPVVRTVYEEHDVKKLVFKGEFGEGGLPIYYCPVCHKKYPVALLKEHCFCCKDCKQWLEVPDYHEAANKLHQDEWWYYDSHRL